MKRFLGFLFVLAVVLAASGAYLGWFNYSSDDGFTANTEKIQQDMGKAKDAVAQGVDKTKEAVSAAASKTKEAVEAAASKTKELAGAAAEKTKAAWDSLSEKTKGAYDSLKAKLGAGETAFVGSVESIDEAAGTIVVKMADGEIATYELAPGADVQVNSGVSTLGSLTSGDEAAIAVDATGKVVKVYAAR